MHAVFEVVVIRRQSPGVSGLQLGALLTQHVPDGGTRGINRLILKDHDAVELLPLDLGPGEGSRCRRVPPQAENFDATTPK